MSINRLLKNAEALGLSPYLDALSKLIEEKERHISQVDGKGKRYLGVMERAFSATPSSCDFSADAVAIGRPDDLSPQQREDLTKLLHELDPWRKGPFNLFGIEIDSEWVSSLKWQRVSRQIAPLTGRKVLDIGCSNGYYLYRMAADRPRLLLGVEPYLTFYFQQQLLQHFARLPDLYCLPVTFEELPPFSGYFDTVFSMGVLYHRRSPFDHLQALREALRPGGELVLETLVIEGAAGQVLVPRDRYARMRNVWFLPSVPELQLWLERAGFLEVRCVDVTMTSTEEQRSTDWMRFESLAQCLDPDDPGKTVEGHPAPRRAIMIARRAET